MQQSTVETGWFDSESLTVDVPPELRCYEEIHFCCFLIISLSIVFKHVIDTKNVKKIMKNFVRIGIAARVAHRRVPEILNFNPVQPT